MSRKSRYDNPFGFSCNEEITKWKAGLYIRLSKEDEDKKDESQSITSQKEILQHFVEKNEDIKLIDYYIDDGYSGTNFDRPGFIKLIKDINSKKINCVIVKDLSRFGRNKIESSLYIEKVFPFLHVRLISIADNIDTEDKENINNSLLIAFKNILNDEYSKDNSLKIKSVKNMRMRKGEYLGGFGCFGYMRNPLDKHKLIIDEPAAEIVKKVFNLYIEHKSFSKVAKILNQEQVDTPLKYKRKNNSNIKIPKFKGKYLWSASTIEHIITNQMYIGNLVQGVKECIDYRLKKAINKPKDEWIIIENTHEPIIDKNTFKLANDIKQNKNNTFNRKQKYENILSGICVCSDCNHNLLRHQTSRKDKKTFIWRCKTALISHECKQRIIKDEQLLKIVYNTIKNHIKTLLKLKELFLNVNKRKQNQEVNCSKLQIEYIKKDIIKNKKNLETIYIELKNNKITEEQYKEKKLEYENKILDYSTKLSLLSQTEEKSKSNSPIDFIDNFIKFKSIKNLTKDMVNELIDKIYIHSNNEIEIVYKFQDEYKKALNYIEENASNCQYIKQSIA